MEEGNAAINAHREKYGREKVGQELSKITQPLRDKTQAGRKYKLFQYTMTFEHVFQ